jgi:DNA polymerase-3 subunit epsilon
VRDVQMLAHLVGFMGVDFFEGERVLAFDLETTGISTSRDRIVQYALIGSDVDGTSIHLDKLVHPQRKIPRDSSEIHGIFDADVQDAEPFSHHAKHLAELMNGAIIVGHNVRQFDLAMLEQEFLRLGQLAPKPKAIFDTLEIVRRLKVPRPHNLGSLCRRHHIDLSNAHTAGADAAATLLLFWQLSLDYAPMFRKSIDELERWFAHGDVTNQDASELGRSLDDLPLVDSEGKIRRDGDQLILAFGRHRGEDVKIVAKDDPAYLHWMLSPNGLDDEHIRTVIRNYINA